MLYKQIYLMTRLGSSVSNSNKTFDFGVNVYLFGPKKKLVSQKIFLG